MRSLVRAFGAEPPAATPPRRAVPLLAIHQAPAIDKVTPTHQAFYESPWFWAGLATAAVVGGAFYLTRDTGPTMLHLELNTPH
jgi:hypothetical protein